MSRSYPTYQAKAHFSEILRQVRAGQTVVISHRGQDIAEIRPLSRPATVEENFARLEALGIIERPTMPRGRLEAVVQRPGGLARFLAERE